MSDKSLTPIKQLAKALEPLYLSSGEGSWRDFYDKNVGDGPRFFPKNPTGTEIENIEKLEKTLSETLATPQNDIKKLIPQLIEATEAFAKTFEFNTSDTADREAVNKNGPIVKSLAKHLTSVQNGGEPSGDDLNWMVPASAPTTKQIAKDIKKAVDLIDKEPKAVDLIDTESKTNIRKLAKLLGIFITSRPWRNRYEEYVEENVEKGGFRFFEKYNKEENKKKVMKL